MTTLSRREKDAIRKSPCGKCGAVPPFPDGSRCQPHRIEPALGYVAGNVVPRCPQCHAAEPGHPILPTVAFKGGRRRQELYPDLSREKMVALNASRTSAERAAFASAATASLTPSERSANVRKGGLLTHQRHPELARENARKAGLALKARLTTTEYSEMRRRGWATYCQRISPAEHAARSRETMLRVNAALTPEERSARARAAGLASAAARRKRANA